MSDETKITRVQELVYELKVGDAMSQTPIVVKPDGLMSELRETLRANRISGAPVVDDGKLVGLISIEDFIKWLAEGAKDCPIRERMTAEVRTLYANEPLVQAVGKFEQSGFGRFPVIDRKSGKLVGLITKGKIIASLLERLQIDYHEEETRRHRASHIFEDIVADSVALFLKSRVESGNFERAGRVSSGLKKALSRLNVHPQLVRRACIASYEAEMNIVIYAKGGEISVEVRPDRIHIDATDTGPGIPDIEKALQPGYSTAPDWVRELGFGAGMGLTNIQKCADSLDVTSEEGKGTHLAIHINIDSESRRRNSGMEQER